MKKSALRCLILTCLFEVALCGWNKYFGMLKTWSDAREYCRQYYTDLSSIRNQEEDLAFRSHPANRVDKVWIGLHKDGNDGWKWSGGQDVLFFNWLWNEPEQKQCVVHSKTGWHTEDCHNKHRFYCFQNTLVLVKENKTWEEAMEQCREQHNDLVSLPNEFALVKTLETSKEAQTDHVWTGMRYLADDWLWVSGKNVSYQAWSPAAMPQCPAWTHHCGALSQEGQLLESWDCADKLNFVCDTNI